MLSKKVLGVAVSGVVLLFIAGCMKQAVAPVITPEPVVQSVPTNEFSIKDLKVGMEVDGLKVTSFGPFNAEFGPMNLGNLKISFEGTSTVSGNYHPVEVLSMGGSASFSLDNASSLNFPKLIGDGIGPEWFSFNNPDAEIIAKLGKVKKQVTVVIKNYTLQRYPSEVSSTADLVEVK